MIRSKVQINAQELAAASPAYRLSQSAQPDPNGNRAQRRAFKRLVKRQERRTP